MRLRTMHNRRRRKMGLLNRNERKRFKAALILVDFILYSKKRSALQKQMDSLEFARSEMLRLGEPFFRNQHTATAEYKKEQLENYERNFNKQKNQAN